LLVRDRLPANGLRRPPLGIWLALWAMLLARRYRTPSFRFCLRQPSTQQLLARRRFVFGHPLELMRKLVEPGVNLVQRDAGVRRFVIEFALPLFAYFAAGIGGTARLFAARLARRFLSCQPVIRLVVKILRRLFAFFAPGNRQTALLAAAMAARMTCGLFFYFRLFNFGFFVEIGEQCRLFVIGLIVRFDNIIEPLADGHA
jgi:hypothetical protein